MSVHRRLTVMIAVTLVIAAGIVYYVYRLANPAAAGRGWDWAGPPSNTITIERTDYNPPPTPPAADAEAIRDDRIDEKVTTFDPSIVDRRPIGDLLVNASEAVIRLDAPMLRPDVDAGLLKLYPSYKAATAAAGGGIVLPSVNMLDGKAKQFDDGMVAALDQAYFLGVEPTAGGQVGLVRRIYDAVGPKSPAAAYLAAGLAVGGVEVAVDDESGKADWRSRFEANGPLSKPIGFYTWSPTLQQAFRFVRYFQAPIPVGAAPVAQAIAAALKADPKLAADYRLALEYQAKMTNPTLDASILDLATGKATLPLPEGKLLSLFPASTSREGELIERLFPLGVPADVDLMRTLIAKIRSGEVSLAPRPDGGWYDYQVHALETLLLPEKGAEANKLLLTRAYKERMIEAFKALITKRRETHARDVKTSEAPTAMPRMPRTLAPRLRLEPAPTYYLRTARAYAFATSYLESRLGPGGLKKLTGLKEGGSRGVDLETELHAIRDLFYGFYLVSCEDIGMKPSFLAGEPVDRVRCDAAAQSWLARPMNDPDLAVDTRVSVPIAIGPGGTRLWTTMGVRLARMTASYVKGPRLRSAEGTHDWTNADPTTFHAADYLIAVDESGEVAIAGARTLNREEFRKLCDEGKTKEGIVAALKGSR